jgi:hypothetical protein
MDLAIVMSVEVVLKTIANMQKNRITIQHLVGDSSRVYFILVGNSFLRMLKVNLPTFMVSPIRA